MNERGSESTIEVSHEKKNDEGGSATMATVSSLCGLDALSMCLAANSTSLTLREQGSHFCRLLYLAL